VLLRLAYLGVTNAFALLRLLPRSDRDKDAEILAPPQAPRANAHAKRWVRTVRRECLDRMLIYGQRHLMAALGEYVKHYNEHRPHQSRDQQPPSAEEPPAAVTDLTAVRVKRRKIVSGLINEYSQAA
jgi:putative transposase